MTTEKKKRPKEAIIPGTPEAFEWAAYMNSFKNHGIKSEDNDYNKVAKAYGRWTKPMLQTLSVAQLRLLAKTHFPELTKQYTKTLLISYMLQHQVSKK